MNNLIDADYAAQYFLSAGAGLCAVFLSSLVGVLLTIRYLKGRLITFMLVLWGLFFVFFATFFGLNFAMREFSDLEVVWGSRAIDIVSLCTAVGLMSLFALYCKFAIHEGPTLMQAELDNLKEEQLSPMDIKRREHLAKYRRR